MSHATLPLPSRSLAAMLALVLVGGGALTGCNAAGPDVEPVPFDGLSGEAFFAGIAFGEGPAASALPEVWGQPEVQAAKAAAATETRREAATHRAYVVNHIRATDPSFFGRFGEALTSGDHLTVKAALDEARGRVTDALGDHSDARVRATAGRVAAGDGADGPGDPAPFAILNVIYPWSYVGQVDAGSSDLLLGGALPPLQGEQVVDWLTTRLDQTSTPTLP